MRWGAEAGRRSAVAAIALLVVVAMATLAPGRAGALDSDLKHSYAFKLEASNGYSILAYAGSERVDGRGELVLIVGRKDAGVFYTAPATVTGTRIDADLGKLGRVALDVTPSGKTTRLRPSCEPRRKPISFEPPTYSGSFEFHGEEGYTKAVSLPVDFTRFFLDFGCTSVGSGEGGGPDVPGARLRLHARRGSTRLELQVNKNRPGARTRFEVGVDEERDGISISRSRTLWVGAGAFDFDSSLRTAVLAPPAPFSGRASFHRGAAPADRWGGDLTVDMPGRSDVPLTGPGIEAALAPACRHEGEGRFRC